MDFFAGTERAGKDLRRRIADELIRKRIAVQKDVCNGDFWPLGYWAKEGLDTARIERESAKDDVLEDRVMGLCYRVWVRGTRLAEITTTVRTEVTVGVCARVCSCVCVCRTACLSCLRSFEVYLCVCVLV